MRKISICYEDEEARIFDYQEFSDETTDFDIDDYCYDVVSECYGNEVWFSWEELD
jgi:aminoglycoside phosphotransferase family enzyme